MAYKTFQVTEYILVFREKVGLILSMNGQNIQEILSKKYIAKQIASDR